MDERRPLAILGAVIVVVLGLRMAVFYAIDGIGSDRLAWLITLFVLAVICVVLFIMWIVGRMWGVRQSAGYTGPAYNDGYDDPSYEQLPQTRQRRNVPVLRLNGEAVPSFDDDEAAPKLLAPPTELSSVVTGNDGTRYEVAALDSDVKKFCAVMWPKPTQKLWNGDTKRYGETANFLIQHGALVRDGRGYSWLPHMTKERVARWVDSL
jgi:hypothetical protein